MTVWELTNDKLQDFLVVRLRAQLRLNNVTLKWLKAAVLEGLIHPSMGLEKVYYSRNPGLQPQAVVAKDLGCWRGSTSDNQSLEVMKDLEESVRSDNGKLELKMSEAYVFIYLCIYFCLS